MARIDIIPDEETPAEMQDIFNKFRSNNLPVINLFRTVGHSPKVGRDFVRLGTAILLKSKLSHKLREIMILRVATLTGSNYEWTQHVRISLLLGIEQQQIDAVPNWSDSDLFSDEERALLQFTDECTQNVRVPDEVYSNVKKYLSDQEILELTVTLGYYGMVARVLETLQVDLE